MGETRNPAALVDHDPEWSLVAGALLAEVREALLGLPGAEGAHYDHIGSTSVPGLAAKPFVDLQVRLLPLPDDGELIARLEPIGFARAQGSNPDSPGVHRDIPRGNERVDPAVWAKSLFWHADHQAILHIRRSDSPWGRHTVWFRDWLREHPAQAARYERMKRELSAEQVGKADYDEYTLAKTAFFDAVQADFEAWGRDGRRLRS